MKVISLTLLTVSAFSLCHAAVAHTSGQDATPSHTPAKVVFRDAPKPEHVPAKVVWRDRDVADIRDDPQVRRSDCLRYTGTRLIRDDRVNQRCAPAPGVVYTRDRNGGNTESVADLLR